MVLLLDLNKFWEKIIIGIFKAKNKTEAILNKNTENLWLIEV